MLYKNGFDLFNSSIHLICGNRGMTSIFSKKSTRSDNAICIFTVYFVVLTTALRQEDIPWESNKGTKSKRNIIIKGIEQ